jgi:hypothetical protein
LGYKQSNAVYNTISKSQEWLTINCVINATKGVLLGFSIFKGEKQKDFYIKLYKASICMVMQKKHG